MVQRAVRGGKRPSLWCEQLHAVVVEVCDRQQERVVAASVAALFARPHEAHSVGPEKLALTFPRSTDPTSTGHQIPQPAAAASRKAPLAQRRLALQTGGKMCRAWEEVEAITIAAIEGWCVGGGAALVAACDLRIASASARHCPSDATAILIHSPLRQG